MVGYLVAIYKNPKNHHVFINFLKNLDFYKPLKEPYLQFFLPRETFNYFLDKKRTLLLLKITIYTHFISINNKGSSKTI